MHKCFKILLFLLTFVSLDVFSQENEFQNFSISEGLQSPSVNDIIQDEIGYLWLATNKGLVRFDGENFKNFNTHNQSKAAVLFSKNNQLIAAQASGLFKIRKDSIVNLGKEKINKISSLNDKVLFGTNQGIYQLINHSLAPLKIQSKIDFSIINDIIQFENAIYIASNNGLWKLDKLLNPTKIHKIIDFNIQSLLVINNQLAIQLKKEIKFYKSNKIVSNIELTTDIASIKNINSKLWITTNGDGIHIYNLPNFTFERKINKYNSNISNNINTVFKDRQNLIWIGSSDNGLYKYSLENISENITKPKLFIESISVNYKKIKILNTKTIELAPNENNIAIRFKTINLKQVAKTTYRYKLNDTYSPWKYNNSIEFANLKSGKYQFLVQSKNGTQLSNEVVFNFNIDKPIYQKTWFYILILSLGFFLVALFIDFRLKQIKKKSKKEIDQLKLDNHLLSLEQKALQLQMNPHFIFNVLNGIKALGNSGNSLELNNTISQFSLLLRNVLNNSRLEEISLNDEIITLKNYLELERKMNSKNFEYHIKTNLNNIDSEELLIPPMLIQPFVENSIKHGIKSIKASGKIEILFKAKNNFLYCTIQDNGIGINHSKKENKNTHQSVAVSVTKERIENFTKYNLFKIEEIIEKKHIIGTKVSFKIPLKTDY